MAVQGPFYLPRLSPAPTTFVEHVRWTLVNFVCYKIKMAIPGFPRVQTAWMFPDGTDIGCRIWVRVPVTLGHTRAYSIEDMESDMWIDCGRGADGPSSDMISRSIKILRFPFDEPRDLVHPFTIVVASQRRTGADVYPPNQLINQLVPELTEPWLGNVLVFKHGKSKRQPIINISDRDSSLVEIIVARVIWDGLVGNEDLSGAD
ncbi:hypothetical protein B0H10DRAFT_2197629 [Mycena sp. CBHHK59/15]|nr:hypothetical protein B0H10DRAFT_2197629 [Mycena sp. CBHHK59/15]